MTQEVKNIDDDGEELFEHYNYIADNGQEKLRIDKFLMAQNGILPQVFKSSSNIAISKASSSLILSFSN